MMLPLVPFAIIALAAAAYEVYVADQPLRELSGLIQRLLWLVYYSWTIGMALALILQERLRGRPLLERWPKSIAKRPRRGKQRSDRDGRETKVSGARDANV